MGKRGNFITGFFILMFLAAGNIFSYFYKTKMSITGFAVSGIEKRLVKLDMPTIIFFAQWLLILLIILVFFIKFLKQKKAKPEKKFGIIEKKGTGTDLDSLYNLLRERKSLKLNSIVKNFHINSEKALEWCKILEESNLAIIEYPAFGEPELKIK